MHCTLLVASAGLLLGAGAIAKPLNRNWTPAAAPWIVHIDMEAAMKSEIGKLGFEGPEPVLAEMSAELQEELGFDLFSEVRSVTVYGLTAEHEEPIVIISTTPEAEARLVAMASEMAETTLVENNRTIFMMGEEGGDETHYGTVLGGPDGERLLVISTLKSQLHGAIDIINGQGRLEANLDQSPLTRGPATGSIVYVSASEIARGLDIAPVALVLQRAEGMRFDLGEVGGQMYIDADIRTNDADEATQLQQMLQGGLAMAQFAAGQNPEFAEIAALATGIQLQLDGRDLAMRFRHDSKDLMARINRLAGDIHLEHEDDHDHDHEHDVEGHHKVKVGKDGAIQE